MREPTTSRAEDLAMLAVLRTTPETLVLAHVTFYPHISSSILRPIAKASP
jgi:hypothetical protein